MTSSRDHVRLLGIFHYVLGGLTAAFAILPVLYMTLGFAFVSGAFDDKSSNPPPPGFGWIFVAFGGFMLVIVLAVAALLILAGRFLQRERHWTFCLVVAAISCAFFPLGTTLGVFTILVLSKDEVKASFAANERPPPVIPAAPPT